MKRFKKPKKNKGLDRDELMRRAEKVLASKAERLLDEKLNQEAGRIGDNIYPVFLLACKDECKLTLEQVKKLDKRVERYLNYVGDGITGLDDVKALLEK